MPPPSRDWRQRLDVETPEHVALAYELAGIGSRGLAALIDTAILGVVALAVVLAVGLLPVHGWLTRVAAVVAQFALVWGYFTLFEAYRDGQTPGKRMVGVRVVYDTGHPVDLAGAAIRNLLRIVDFLPPPYFTGIVLVAFHPRAKRVGDLVAGTIVVRDRPEEAAPVSTPGPLEDATGLPELADEEWALLTRFHQRGLEVEPEIRTRLAQGVAERLAGHLPPGGDAEALERLYHQEAARRRGRLAGTAQRGADRFVARKSERWEEYATLADRVARTGLDGLGPDELLDFAARYRELAADLARARTYGVDGPTVARLERLVAAGHNALYRRERTTWAAAWRFVGRESPAAVVGAWRAVLLAATVFALPALAGYLTLREDPPLAYEVLPDVLLARAQAGAEEADQGHGYFDAPEGTRPLVATSIITNNIGVAFRCFAGGAIVGVGALVLLAFNGLQIGAASGHFANQGLLGYLWTFVLGHGALELFAIWVSGAAGFLLGRAIIAPGEYSRGDALVLAGRVGIRMVTAAMVMLLVAGLIEGFVSAGAVPVPVRAAASVGSLIFLAVYLAAGGRSHASAPTSPAGAN